MDPHHFVADPNPAIYVIKKTDLDPAFHFNADSDPAFQCNADTYPAPH
jgi:hypothetical protein